MEHLAVSVSLNIQYLVLNYIAYVVYKIRLIKHNQIKKIFVKYFWLDENSVESSTEVSNPAEGCYTEKSVK